MHWETHHLSWKVRYYLTYCIGHIILKQSSRKFRYQKRFTDINLNFRYCTNSVSDSWNNWKHNRFFHFGNSKRGLQHVWLSLRQFNLLWFILSHWMHLTKLSFAIQAWNAIAYSTLSLFVIPFSSICNHWLYIHDSCHFIGKVSQIIFG